MHWDMGRERGKGPAFFWYFPLGWSQSFLWPKQLPLLQEMSQEPLNQVVILKFAVWSAVTNSLKLTYQY
jgi:hypothetical protein